MYSTRCAIALANSDFACIDGAAAIREPKMIVNINARFIFKPPWSRF